MHVRDALEARRSIRAFLPDPVPRETLRRVLSAAARAPSGGNLQPWIVTVLDGEPLARFLAEVENTPPGPTEYPVYPPNLHEPYRSRRFAVGEAMYAGIGVPREDKAARLRWFARNLSFFGAPCALFVHVDRRMGAAQWADLGMYLQSVMLLLVEEGYDSCAQEAWAVHHALVDRVVGADPQTMLFCGLAIGRRDPDHPINGLRTERAPEDEWLRFL